MKEWFKNNIYEFNFFVGGFCASSALYCLADQNYGMAALNAVLSYINIRLAKQ